MSDATTTREEALRAEDLLAVRSRVSWGAIFAGAVMALAVYLVLTLLGASLGFSLSDRVRADNLATGAAVWAVATTILALFVGGWVTSQCAVGENKAEAVVHGIIMWGVVLAFFLWMVATGVRMGFGAMVGMANLTATAASGTDWQALAREQGVTQADLDAMRARAEKEGREWRAAASDPSNQQAARDAATNVSWWTLLGTMLSMVAAVGGSLLGAGPTIRLLPAGALRNARMPSSGLPAPR